MNNILIEAIRAALNTAKRYKRRLQSTGHYKASIALVLVKEGIKFTVKIRAENIPTKINSKILDYKTLAATKDPKLALQVLVIDTFKEINRGSHEGIRLKS